MKNFKFSILLLISLTSGCTRNQESEQKKLEQEMYDEVMIIHDEVMPKISKILSLEKELEIKADQIDSLDIGNSEQIDIYNQQISRLQEADEAMMQWMRNFEVDQEGWPHDSIMSYLKKEKERISKVRDQMLGAIGDAETMLGN